MSIGKVYIFGRDVSTFTPYLKHVDELQTNRRRVRVLIGAIVHGRMQAYHIAQCLCIDQQRQGIAPITVCLVDTIRDC
jgi:hypothetical protein